MQPARTTKRTWTEAWSRPTTTPGPTTRPNTTRTATMATILMDWEHSSESDECRSWWSGSPSSSSPGSAACSSTASCKSGEVRVRDPLGNELIVHGRLGEDEGKLKQGDKVVLIELDNESGLFQVAALKE